MHIRYRESMNRLQYGLWKCILSTSLVIAFVIAGSTLGDDLSQPKASAVSKLKEKILLNSKKATEITASGSIRRELLAHQNKVIESIDTLLKQEQLAAATEVMQGEGPSESEKLTDDESRKGQSEANTTQEPNASDSSNGDAGMPTNQSGNGLGKLRNHVILNNSVWGHLPPREQRELMRNFNESFHPDYADRVRDYFERLAKIHFESENQSVPSKPLDIDGQSSR